MASKFFGGPLRATCVTCGAQWEHQANCPHCVACHADFGTVADYERHRVGLVPYRECLSVVSLGMKQDAEGRWFTP